VKVASGATTVAEYRYDPDASGHRRIARLVPDGANWDRTDFYYTRSPALRSLGGGGWQVVEERFADAQADKDAVATTAKYQYVWSLRYIDACILRDEDKDADGDCTDAEGAGGSERLYYASGANMEVTAVVSTSGTVQERYTYTPYGQPTIHDDDWSDTKTWDNSKKNEIRFCGYHYDGESGLYHVRYRMYHPTLGRWVQRDPLRYVDGMHASAYVVGAPTHFVDPSGRAVTAQYGKDLLRGRYPHSEGSSLWQIADRGDTIPKYHARATKVFDLLKTLEKLKCTIKERDGKRVVVKIYFPRLKYPRGLMRRLLTIRREITGGYVPIAGTGDRYTPPSWKWQEKKGEGATDGDHCHVVLYIGHSLGREVFAGDGQNAPLEVHDLTTGTSANGSLTDVPLTTPTIGIVSCFAPKTLVGAKDSGYYTLPTDIQASEKIFFLPTDGAVRSSEEEKRLARLLVTTEKLLTDAIERVKALCRDKRCLERGVRVDIVSGQE